MRWSRHLGWLGGAPRGWRAAEIPKQRSGMRARKRIEPFYYFPNASLFTFVCLIFPKSCQHLVTRKIVILAVRMNSICCFCFRASIFKVHLSSLKTQLDRSELSRRMAAMTPGFSGEMHLVTLLFRTGVDRMEQAQFRELLGPSLCTSVRKPNFEHLTFEGKL